MDLQTGTQTEFFKRRSVMVELHRKTLQVYLAVINNVEKCLPFYIYSLVSASDAVIYMYYNYGQTASPHLRSYATK